jgi:hypothetical protein
MKARTPSYNALEDLPSSDKLKKVRRELFEELCHETVQHAETVLIGPPIKLNNPFKMVKLCNLFTRDEISEAVKKVDLKDLPTDSLTPDGEADDYTKLCLKHAVLTKLSKLSVARPFKTWNTRNTKVRWEDTSWREKDERYHYMNLFPILRVSGFEPHVEFRGLGSLVGVESPFKVLVSYIEELGEKVQQAIRDSDYLLRG